jgi:hypothetical protein
VTPPSIPFPDAPIPFPKFPEGYRPNPPYVKRSEVPAEYDALIEKAKSDIRIEYEFRMSFVKRAEV